jgi:hypothetical protein
VEELKQQATMEHSISEILLKEVNNKLDENEVQFERAREPQGLEQREIYEEMAASVESEMTLTDRIRAKQGAFVQEEKETDADLLKSLELVFQGSKQQNADLAESRFAKDWSQEREEFDEQQSSLLQLQEHLAQQQNEDSFFSRPSDSLITSQERFHVQIREQKSSTAFRYHRRKMVLLGFQHLGSFSPVKRSPPNSG